MLHMTAGEGLRRWLMVIACIGVLALLAASAASATVSFSTGTQTWFIGRGDVVGKVGKGALVATPEVVWRSSASWTATCNYADGSHLPLSYDTGETFVYVAKARHAKNGAITGYIAGVPQIEDTSSSSPPGRLCSIFGGSRNWVSITDVTNTKPYAETLTFQGVPIPAPYAYIFCGTAAPGAPICSA